MNRQTSHHFENSTKSHKMLVKCTSTYCLKLTINIRYAEIVYYPFVLARYEVLDTHSR